MGSIEETVRRIQSANEQARTRQTAAFSGLVEQTLNPERAEIDVDEIIAALSPTESDTGTGANDNAETTDNQPDSDSRDG